MTIKIPSQMIRRKRGKLGVDMPYVQSRMHSDYDSAESIADLDLEDGELRKMLASPLYVHGRGGNCGSSQKPTASGKPKAKKMQKRGASAQRTQSDDSREESLKSTSSQEPRASGKPDAVFSSRSDEPGNQFESSMFKFAHPSKLGRSLLEGNKDHLLSQARSELMRQEHQDWNYRTLIMDILNLEENKLVYEKNNP